ncbi:MAG: hypothetical protein ACFFE8_14535 [Candidatus Heimdallarchaeota archaeon]
MASLFFFLFLSDLVFLAIINSIDGALLLILIVPWTFAIYGILCFPGFRFSRTDILHHMAGRLFWIGKGAFQSTLIAVFNLMSVAILVSDQHFAQIDQYFGGVTSLFILLFLPLPGFLILTLKQEDMKRVSDFMYREMIQQGEVPAFLGVMAELLRTSDRFSEAFRSQLDIVLQDSTRFLKANFQEISPYFSQDLAFHLSLENLVLLLTKKVFAPEIPSEFG